MEYLSGRNTLMAAVPVTALLALAACSTGEIKEDNRPNIVLIMADDVKPGHFSCYGGDIPTPNIDKVASEGMMFYGAYCTSAACTPSRYSVLTGHYAGRCKHPEFLNANPADEAYKLAWNTPLEEDIPTLHKILGEAGYYTGFVGKFHVGDLDFDDPSVNPSFPDIDVSMEPTSGMADSLLEIHQEIIGKRVRELTGCDFTASIQWENPETLPIERVRYHNLEWITRGAAGFFESVKGDKPFFLHFNTTALQGIMEHPYMYQPDRKTIYNRLDSLGIVMGEEVPDHVKHYNSGIIYLDDQIGAIMKMIKDNKLDKNTMVIITADHGIEPGKSTCYEIGVKVPFIVWWPGKVQPGSTSDEFVQFTDFMPTFAEAGNGIIPAGYKPDGVSFIPLLEGKKNSRDMIYTEMGYERSVRKGDYKYIATRFPVSVVERMKSGKLDAITHLGTPLHGHAYIAAEYQPGYFDADQLYDLSSDPWEQVNLAGDPEYGKILADMKMTLEKELRTFSHPYDLDDTSFEDMEVYRKLSQKTLERGTAFIPWWNRKLDYPPSMSE